MSEVCHPTNLRQFCVRLCQGAGGVVGESKRQNTCDGSILAEIFSKGAKLSSTLIDISCGKAQFQNMVFDRDQIEFKV